MFDNDPAAEIGSVGGVVFGGIVRVHRMSHVCRQDERPARSTLSGENRYIENISVFPPPLFGHFQPLGRKAVV